MRSSGAFPWPIQCRKRHGRAGYDKKLFHHNLLYQTHRQISSNQIIAIESVLNECNNLLCHPIGMRITSAVIMAATPAPAPDPPPKQASESTHAGDTDPQGNIANRLNLRQGNLRNLIEALDNDRIAGKPIDTAMKHKKLKIDRPLAKFRGDVSDLKINRNDKELLLALLK